MHLSNKSGSVTYKLARVKVAEEQRASLAHGAKNLQFALDK
jgi:hypothetical protein